MSEIDISQLINQFKRDGFVVLKRQISPAVCQEIGNTLSRAVEVISAQSSRDITNRWYLTHRTDSGVLYDVYQRFPEARKAAEVPEVTAFLKSYFNRSVYLYVNSYLYKPADKDNEVPWHQDFLNRPNETEKVLAWVSLDSATQENGCLQVIPGSHKRGFRKWFHVEGATHHDRIVLDKNEESNQVFVETEPGDIVLFSNYLIHSSAQNSSDLPRRALRFVYKALDDDALPRGSMIMIHTESEDFYTAVPLPRN